MVLSHLSVFGVGETTHPWGKHDLRSLGFGSIPILAAPALVRRSHHFIYFLVTV